MNRILSGSLLACILTGALVAFPVDTAANEQCQVSIVATNPYAWYGGPAYYVSVQVVVLPGNQYLMHDVWLDWGDGSLYGWTDQQGEFNRTVGHYYIYPLSGSYDITVSGENERGETCSVSTTFVP